MLKEPPLNSQFTPHTAYTLMNWSRRSNRNTIFQHGMSTSNTFHITVVQSQQLQHILFNIRLITIGLGELRIIPTCWIEQKKKKNTQKSIDNYMLVFIVIIDDCTELNCTVWHGRVNSTVFKFQLQLQFHQDSCWYATSINYQLNWCGARCISETNLLSIWWNRAVILTFSIYCRRLRDALVSFGWTQKREKYFSHLQPLEIVSIRVRKFPKMYRSLLLYPTHTHTHIQGCEMILSILIVITPPKIDCGCLAYWTLNIALHHIKKPCEQCV